MPQFHPTTRDYGFLTQHPIHSTMADREQSPTHGPHAPRESNDPPASGNRPATGARVVDRATPFSGGFGGGAEATDFLGLSQELSGIDSGALHARPTGAPGAELGPGEYPTDPESSASWLLQPDQLFEGAGESTHAQALEAASADGPRGTRTFSTWHKVAAALFVGAAATFGYRLWAGDERTGVLSPNPIAPRIAHAPKADPSELADPTGGAGGRQGLRPDGGWSDPEFRPVTDAGPGAEPGAAASDESAAPTPDATASTESTGGEIEIDLTPAPVAPRLGEQRLAQWVEEHGWAPSVDPAAPVSGSLLTTLLGLGATTSPAAMPPAGMYAPDPSASAEFAADPTGSTMEPGDSAVPSALRRGEHAATTPANSPIGGLRLATPEELAGIWPGDTVPVDGMDAEPRLLTPAVGNVHVIMKTGDIFDGRLYAIGTGQVWLETGIGRLALAGNRVREITVVTTEEVNGKLVEDLPRMRVRTPGGLFFGKVVAHEDDRVTLLTEDGGKITLVSRDVEPAPLGDTRVIGRVEKP